MSNRKPPDQSFLDGALDFASLEARHWVADAMACYLHNTGYDLDGNTEASDVTWFARVIWQGEHRMASPAIWDNAAEDFREGYRRTARAVIRALPEYQLRVAHRLIELSKVVRDIERHARHAWGWGGFSRGRSAPTTMRAPRDTKVSRTVVGVRTRQRTLGSIAPREQQTWGAS
jgi:hypothetical protein